MRTSKDVYINPLGKLIMLGQSEQSEEFIKSQGLKLYNGYDYQNQYWVHNGEQDTRSIEQLKYSVFKQEWQKNHSISPAPNFKSWLQNYK